MGGIYGQRWSDSFGDIPSPEWSLAIEALTSAAERRAILAIIRTRAQHPPNLLEFLELAAGGEKPKGEGPEPYTAEWNEARKAIFAKIEKQSRERGVRWSDRDRARSKAAIALIENPPGTIGHSAALDDYARAP